MIDRKKGFLKILNRYINNSSDQQEKKLMDLWYDSIDHNDDEKDFQSNEELENRMWDRIKMRKNEHGPTHASVRSQWWNTSFLKLATAASVLIVLSFVYYLSPHSKKPNFPAGIMTEQQLALFTETNNNSSTKKLIVLADGSRVTLDPGSTLHYTKSFTGGIRIVYLDGNGFFDIAKNPEKPFLVYTDDIVTKVLGTSFTITTNQSGSVKVAVMTGKVIVEKAEGSKTDFEQGSGGIVLTPNKTVTFSDKAEKYVTGLVDKPVVIGESKEYLRPDAFSFEEVNLDVVVAKLEKAYGVEIKIENQAILKCPITADLQSESVFAKLEIINALLNTKSEINGTTIFLTGGECTPFKANLQP